MKPLFNMIIFFGGISWLWNVYWALDDMPELLLLFIPLGILNWFCFFILIDK